MSIFLQRREKLFSKMLDNSASIFFAGVTKTANEDAELPFVVNKNFYYLTGIDQPGSVLLLVKGLGENKTYLFIDEYNAVKEKWTGKKLTPAEASEISSISNISSNATLDTFLSMILSNEATEYGIINKLYIDLTPEIKIDSQTSTKDLAEAINKKKDFVEIINVKPILTEMRMVKSFHEVEEMKKAINLTANGISNLILNMKAGDFEYSLADSFEFYGRSHDRSKLAFDTIVASGKNATILHYPTQNDRIQENDLVLFDLGFAHKYYCADISRTYPISGTFSEKQRKVYEAVLNCNKALIEYAKPGLYLKDLQAFAVEFLKNECLRLKLIKSEDEIIKHYYHNCSHHLGLDTHDCSNRELPLAPGNVITIEPGLYFAEDNIGVRIEDDILITEGRSENLSYMIPKEIEDIERLFKMKG
jgi:Xaa-Pro aminopeptidase